MSTTTAAPPEATEEIEERLLCLVQRAQCRDVTALPELRYALDTNPWLWLHYAELARQTQETWVSLIVGENQLLRESLRRQVQQMRTAWAGPEPSPLEGLLVERVVATWLEMQFTDTVTAQLQNLSPAKHAAALKKQNGTRLRHRQARKVLATVRKLLRPTPSSVDSCVTRPS